MRTMKVVVAGSVICLFLSLSICKANLFSYGSFNGDTVVYQDVTEDSLTDTGPLFRTPIISGDSIDFNPIFKATATDGASDLTDGQLLMTISAKEGKYIDEVTFSESGDYRLLGTGTSATYAMVLNSLFVDIYQVYDPVTETRFNISNISLTGDMIFSPSDGDYYLTIDPATGVWTGNVTIDLTAALAANGWANYYATKVSVNLDNTLIAQSQVGTTAYIAKKDADGLGITAETSNVPEPATMIVLALGGLLIRRK